MNLTLVTFITVIICSVLFPKSKLILWLSIIILVLLSANNDLIADRSVYEAMYTNLGYYADIDIGFQYLIKFSRYLNIPFKIFVIFILLIGFYLTFRIVVKMTKYPGLVLIMYLVFPFFNDIAQLRSFLGMSLLINGVYYLMFSEKKRVNIFVIFTLLATSIHYTYSFFFLLLLFDKKLTNKSFGRKEKNNGLLITIATTLLLLILSPFLIKIISILSPLLGNRILSYFSTDTSVETRLLLLFIFSLTFCVINYWLNKQIEKKNIPYYILNLLLLLVFPFVFFSIEFLRIYRALFIFNYILFSNNIIRVFTLDDIRIKDILGTLLLVLYFSILYVYFDMTLINESILIPFFNSNTLFN